MSLSTQTMNPVTTPSMLYPSLFGLKPYKKHYQCPRCGGNMYTRLQAQIVRKAEVVFGFACDACKQRWYVSSKLLLNEVCEEQIQKMNKFTKATGKEFGALLVKTPEGIRLDMIDIGEDTSVTFKKTKEYRKDEKVIGSIHIHPYSSEPSNWDIVTFLRDSWEKISMVVGADDSINVMVKTLETIKIPEEDLQNWIKENEESTLIEKANKYKFLLFKGKVNNLTLLAGVSSLPVTTLERLLRYIE